MTLFKNILYISLSRLTQSNSLRAMLIQLDRSHIEFSFTPSCQFTVTHRLCLSDLFRLDKRTIFFYRMLNSYQYFRSVTSKSVCAKQGSQVLAVILNCLIISLKDILINL